jgi:hypothetical protein
MQLVFETPFRGGATKLPGQLRSKTEFGNEDTSLEIPLTERRTREPKKPSNFAFQKS